MRRLITTALLTAAILTAHAPAQSLNTTFGNNFGGARNWTTFFDLTVNTAVNVLAFDLNVNGATGSSGFVDIYVTAAGGTHVGNETVPVWTLAATTVPTATRGTGLRTSAILASPWSLTPGTFGVAVHYRGNWGPLVTIGTGFNQTYTNSELSLTGGSVTIAGPGQSSAITFTPRVWNGTIYYNYFATAIAVGQGCGTNPMELRVGNRPILGTTASVETVEISPAALTAALLTDFTGSQAGVDLTPIGMTGCGLHSNGRFAEVFMPMGAPTQSHSFTIGNDPALIGRMLYLQSMAVVLGENPFGIVLSNGVIWTVDRQ